MSPATMDLGQLLAEESAKLETVTVNRARRYRTPAGVFPSVTNALSVLDKPALLHWSGMVERELCVETFTQYAIRMYGDSFRVTESNAENFKAHLLDHIGTKLACYRKRDEAGDIGTDTHALIEYHLKRRLGFVGIDEPEIPNTPQGDAALWAYLQFEQFQKSVDLKPVAMEVAVWSEMGYAGRLDLLAYVNGRLSILDWKTGKDIYTEAHIQNSAYRYALNERLTALGRPERVELGHIVLLPKVVTSDTTFRVEESTASFAAFSACLALWNALEALKKGAKK